MVASLGLLYATFARGDDSIMVPNSIVLASAVVPLREPSSVDLHARLRPDVKPSEVQELLDEDVHTPVRSESHIGLEEIDADEVVVRVAATPSAEADGPAPGRRDPRRDRTGHPGRIDGGARGRARGRDGRRDESGPRPRTDPPGHVTQEHES